MWSSERAQKCCKIWISGAKWSFLDVRRRCRWFSRDWTITKRHRSSRGVPLRPSQSEQQKNGVSRLSLLYRHKENLIGKWQSLLALTLRPFARFLPRASVPSPPIAVVLSASFLALPSALVFTIFDILHVSCTYVSFLFLGCRVISDFQISGRNPGFN